MQKVSEKIIAYLKLNGCSGDIESLELANGLDEKDLTITNCTFLSNNKIYGRVSLRNSTIESSMIQEKVLINDSIIKRSFVGSGTSILNYSIVSDTIISKTTLPESNVAYVSIINNSQISGDVILGGCDFNKTKSRGGSLFCFAHIGGGEFKRSVILGTPPNAKSSKTLVEVGHFGYYGDLLILGLRTADKTGKSYELDSDEYFSSIKTALLNAFFEKPLPGNVTVERGRANIGGGTAISNYDPIRETKAGAIILLSSIGANVTLSPYLTILPHSLVANGSIDITRERNIIAENSLVIGARSQGIILENYYTDSKKQIMNERSGEEIAYLQRYLSFLTSLAEVCASGADSADTFEAFGWTCAVQSIDKIAREVAQKSIPKYLGLLEKSVETIRLMQTTNPAEAEKFEARLLIHSKVLDETMMLQEMVDSKIEALDQSLTVARKYDALDRLGKDATKAESVAEIIFTQKQQSIAKNDLSNINE